VSIQLTLLTHIHFTHFLNSFANGLPGLATAYADRSPVFVVTSSPPLRDAETNSLQGFHDQVVLAKPMTKFAHRVTNVEEIPRIISYAMRMATSGAPGPVVVDFPIDILFGPPRMGAISYGSLTAAPSLPPGPNPEAMKELVELWKTAKRPVFITGTGAARTSDGKVNLLLKAAEAASTPVFFSNKFATPDVIGFDNPLRCGPATGLAFLRPTGKQPPDLVILLGARTGFMLGGRNGVVIPHAPECKTVQVDIDGGEIGKSLPIHLGIVSDASQFLMVLLELIKSTTFSVQEDWIETCGAIKTVVHQQYGKDPKVDAKDGALHPYHAVNDVYKALAPHHPVVIVDGGEAGVWAMDLWESAQPHAGMNSTGYLGFLGNGYGYSLGAALAFPDRIIVNLHGDGSAGFHIAELDTYARHGLKVLTIVVNNYKWGMSIAGQDIIYGEDDAARPVSSLSPVCKFEIVAEGFGCVGARIEKPDEIQDKVRDIVEKMVEGRGRAGLINLIVSTSPVTNATKGMVGKPEKGTGEDVIVVPYYDNVSRPYYKEDLEKQGWTRK
jgi:thiamine pyrophosphate-dependent acetolactate synthase large subunit-like protein